MTDPFPPQQARLTEQDQQRASSFNKGHGRIERRTLVTTTVLQGYSDWPGLQQAFRLERQRTVHGRTTTEMAYGITSLPRQLADAERLLALCRGHWGIENSLFHVRDVTFGEDLCRVHSGAAPQVLAAVRNAIISLLNAAGVCNKAAALRRHAAQPDLALALLHDTS
jgi:hypothetical protein